jgi:hypothetical protein
MDTTMWSGGGGSPSATVRTTDQARSEMRG